MADEKKLKVTTEVKKMEKKEKSPTSVKKTVRRKKTSVSKKAKDKPESSDTSEETKVSKKEVVSEPVKEVLKEVPVQQPVAEVPVVSRHPPKRNLNQRRYSVDLSDIKPTTKYLSSLKGKRSIVGLTAYDAIMSKLISKAGVDFIDRKSVV